MRDVTFFKYAKQGRLRRLGRNTTDKKKIMTADGFALKIGNQKNG